MNPKRPIADSARRGGADSARRGGADSARRGGADSARRGHAAPADPRPTFAASLLAFLPPPVHRQWAPVGRWAVRHQPTDTLVSGSVPTHPVPAAAQWLVVPALDFRRWAAAWSAGGVAACAEWVHRTGRAEAEAVPRRWVTFQGTQLRFRKPGVRFGDPLDSP